VCNVYVYLLGKESEFVDGSPCSFVAVIDMSYMVYFNFFVCVLTPLVAMFAIYGYIYTVVRRHIARIAATTPTVTVATIQLQDLTASEPSTSTSPHAAEADTSNTAKDVQPATPARQGTDPAAMSPHLTY